MAQYNACEKILEQSRLEGKYDLLRSQLNTDLARAGQDEHYGKNISKHVLARSFIAFLYDLILSDFEAYLNLLYIVDVNEQKIKELPEQRVDELAIAVAALICEREYQKVSYKNR